MTRARVLAIASVVSALALACTKKNPKYCDETTPCPNGATCNTQTNACNAVDGGMDAQDASSDAKDASDGGDARFRCTLPSQCADGGPDGAAAVCEVEAGLCVECVTDADCKATARPICDLALHTCGACTTDAQCAAKDPTGPGVCMSHQDGRCAADAETIYVKNATGCVTTAAVNAGTKAVPYCYPQNGVDAVDATRRLVVMSGPTDLRPWTLAVSGSQVSVVGQAAVTIAPGADVGIHLSAGSLYVRGLRVRNGSLAGVVADGGSDLQMDHCSVESNVGGGIFVDGASFDIVNTTVTGNGPGDDMGASWGGLRLKNLLTSGDKNLRLLTVQSNNQVGVSCSGSVSGMNVLATMNTGGVDVSPTCGFTPCTADAGTTCGAQN
jgi:hypothetical protein